MNVVIWSFQLRNHRLFACHDSGALLCKKKLKRPEILHGQIMMILKSSVRLGSPHRVRVGWAAVRAYANVRYVLKHTRTCRKHGTHLHDAPLTVRRVFTHKRFFFYYLLLFTHRVGKKNNRKNPNPHQKRR